MVPVRDSEMLRLLPPVGVAYRVESEDVLEENLSPMYRPVNREHVVCVCALV